VVRCRHVVREHIEHSIPAKQLPGTCGARKDLARFAGSRIENRDWLAIAERDVDAIVVRYEAPPDLRRTAAKATQLGLPV
jgi:hypothetical protein